MSKFEKTEVTIEDEAAGPFIKIHQSAEYKVIDPFIKNFDKIGAIKALRNYRLDNGGDYTLKSTHDFVNVRKIQLGLDK